MQLLPVSAIGWALSFLCYGAAAIAASWLSGTFDLPESLQGWLLAFAAPLWVLSMPLQPFLRRSGLIVTAYWSLPTIPPRADCGGLGMDDRRLLYGLGAAEARATLSPIYTNWALEGSGPGGQSPVRRR